MRLILVSRMRRALPTRRESLFGHRRRLVLPVLPVVFTPLVVSARLVRRLALAPL